MYNIICNPDLDVGKAAIRGIQYVWMSCIKYLELPWNNTIEYTNQDRYSVNKNCSCYNVLDGVSTCNIITLKTTSKYNIEINDEVFNTNF